MWIYRVWTLSATNFVVLEDELQRIDEKGWEIVSLARSEDFPNDGTKWIVLARMPRNKQ